MGISPHGIEFIKSFEAFRAQPYLDSANIWTIGYGTTRINGARVTKDTPPCTEPQAVVYLTADVNAITHELNQLLFNIVLTQNQIDALYSFAYNCGFGALSSSTLYHALISTRPITENMFTRWNKVHDPSGKLVELGGLTRRRRAEFQLFSE